MFRSIYMKPYYHV